MAKLTQAEYITEVALTCRNLPTTDPYYSSILTYVNRARNKIIRMAIGPNNHVDLFPELQNTWTAGPLSDYATTGIPKPSDAIVIHEVHVALATSAPDWTVTRESYVTFMTREKFGLGTSSTSAGLANTWTRRGSTIHLSPRPSVTNESYARLYGIKSEIPLASPTATFWSDEQWDDVTVLMAAAMLQRRRGWTDRASELFEEVDRELSQTANIAALEALGQNTSISVEGAPTRSSVYNG